MSYTVELTRSATRELRRVPEPYHGLIIRALQGLAIDPRPKGCKKLAGPSGLYRVRVGVYRVIYEVSDRIKLVMVERIADRKDAYK
ncbi:MAG: type II toxin-antitoxin system RelE/ParE family toxin [Flavobacteriales bacterium]|nr:type II toxin-antitoxin system RelE/ParE family toxin [Flavobacteriales bacterium]